MKLFISSVMLVTLAACGGKNDKNPPIDMEKVADAVEVGKLTLVVGKVATSTTSGTIVRFSENTATNPQVTGEVVAHGSTRREIILKVEGDKYYTYVTETSDTGVPSSKVELNSVGPDELQEIFKKPGVSFSGTSINFNVPLNFEDSTSVGITYASAYILNFRVNLADPFCDNSIRASGATTVTDNSGTRTFPQVSLRTNTSCESELQSPAELKMIYLTSVLFCDETDNNDDCEFGKNMEFLTADL